MQPAFGTFFQNTDDETIYQWDGYRWQGLGPSGSMSRSALLRQLAQEAQGRAAYAFGAGAGGASPGTRRAPGGADAGGVVPPPGDPGDPSVDDPTLFTAPPAPGAPTPGGMDVPILRGGGGDSRSQTIVPQNGNGTSEFEDFNRTTAFLSMGTASCGLPWTVTVPLTSYGVSVADHFYYDGNGGVFPTYENLQAHIGPHSAWAGSFTMRVRLQVHQVGSAFAFVGPQYAYWLGNIAGTQLIGVGFLAHNTAGNIFIFDQTGTVVQVAKVDWVANTWYILEWQNDGATQRVRVYREVDPPPAWQASASPFTIAPLWLLTQSLNIDGLASQYVTYIQFRRP
jgi:hypothetical protein